jgi:hypothetical protein
MAVARPSITVVPMYRIIRRHIPDDQHNIGGHANIFTLYEILIRIAQSVERLGYGRKSPGFEFQQGKKVAEGCMVGAYSTDGTCVTSTPAV